MTTKEKSLVAVLLAMALALPLLSYYSFRVGVKTGAEVGGRVIILRTP